MILIVFNRLLYLFFISGPIEPEILKLAFIARLK